jgi:tetratricopeptide (TPR) repeat protein
MSLAAALLAMKTKEFAVTLPLAVLLFEWCFFGRPDRRVLLSLAPLLSTIFIIPLGMVSLHEPIGRILSDVNTMTVASSSLSRWEYLCTQFSVIVTYLRLLVLPVNQNLDYDYPVNHSLFEPRTFLPLILLMALLAAAVMLWRAGSSPESRVTGHESRLLRLAAFGIFWFFLTLLVESSIVPIHDVIFEHRLYLPSVGFLLALTALVMAGAGNLKGRIPVAEKLAVAALIIAAGLLATATYSRNRIWRDPITLWHDVKAKSPNKVRPYNILGTYYAEQGRVADAIREFEMSVRLKPTDVAILDLLAQSYLLAGRQKDAEAMQKSLEKVDPLGEKLQESLQKIENLKRIQR